MPRIIGLLACLAALLCASSPRAETLVVPSGPALGDGRTATTVQLYLPDWVPGERFKLKPDEGRAGQLGEAADGLVSFTYTPPQVSKPKIVGFTLLRKGGSAGEDRFELALVPPYAGSLGLSFDPPVLLAGGDTALVRVTPSGDTPQASESRRFLLQASAGELAAAMPAGDGSWVARYTPPATVEGPRTVIITAADAAAPDLIFGWAALPIRVKQSVSVGVQPDANTILTVGSKQYGPLQASPAGTVAFDVELDPREPTGSVQAVTPTGESTNLRIDLPQPDYGRVGFLPLPVGVPADPVNVELPVRIVATDLTGGPLRASIPELHASVGQLGSVETSSVPGVYVASYTPPSDPGEVAFTATLDGASVTTTLKLLPPMTRLRLEADPAELPEGARDFTITARVQDSGGASVSGRMPELDVQGAVVIRRMRDNGDGTYTGQWRLNRDVEVASVLGVPPLEASGLPPYRLLVWPRQSAIPAGGGATLPVTIACLDRFGLPVPNVDIKLAVPSGDAALPANTRTNDQGLIMASLSAGGTPGMVTLRAEAAGLVAETPVFQVAQGQLAPPMQPGGDTEQLQALALWRSAVSTLNVGREGAAPSAGPPAMVQVVTVPPYTTPGAAILVTVRVNDATGIPLPGLDLELKSSLGTVGALTDNGDGSYNIPVQLPPGQDGPLTLTATAGDVTSPLLLPTMAQAGAMPIASAPQPGQPAYNTGGANNAGGGARRAPPVSGGLDGPAVARIYGGLSLLAHDYLMEGTGEGTTPLEASYTTGNCLAGQFGGAPSVLAGGWVRLGQLPLMLELEGSAWLETVDVAGDEHDNTGYQGHFGARYYSWLSGPLYWYALAGVHHTKALAFAYGDETRSSVELATHNLTGLRIGGGLGVEAGPFWAELDATGTWGAHALPQVLAPRLAMGIEPKEGTMIFLAYAFEARNIRIELDGDGGQLYVKDKYQPLTIGVGGAFR
jgi:hypothetical protein